MKEAKRNYLLSRIFVGTLVVLLLIGMIGCIISVIIAETRLGTPEEDGAWVAAAVFIAVLFLSIALFLPVYRFGASSRLRYEDERERLDSEESFFVGENLLFTFGENGATIHNETAGGEEISVSIPYSDIACFDFWLRRTPKAKGERSILVKIPAKYLSKDPKERSGEPSLVTMTYKQRLLDAIDRHSVSLTRCCEGCAKNTKKLFSVTAKSSDVASKSSAVSVVAGGLLIVAGVVLAFLLESAVLGVALAVFGAILCGKSVFSLLRNGKTGLVVSAAGVWWREANQYDSLFLRWEDVSCVKLHRHGGETYVAFVCPFGSYYFPDIDGLSGFLRERFSEKWADKA